MAVYVDDIILASKSLIHIQEFIKLISQSFHIKDIGNLHYFSGVKITHPKIGKIWIGQPEYSKEILEKFQMEKWEGTPIEVGIKLIKSEKTASCSIRKYFNQRLDVCLICQQEFNLLLEIEKDLDPNQQCNTGRL